METISPVEQPSSAFEVSSFCDLAIFDMFFVVIVFVTVMSRQRDFQNFLNRLTGKPDPKNRVSIRPPNFDTWEERPKAKTARASVLKPRVSDALSIASTRASASNLSEGSHDEEHERGRVSAAAQRQNNVFPDRKKTNNELLNAFEVGPTDAVTLMDKWITQDRRLGASAISLFLHRLAKAGHICPPHLLAAMADMTSKASDWSIVAFSAAMYGMRLTPDSAECRALILSITDKIEQYPTQFNNQATCNTLYGLSRCGDSPEARRLLEVVAKKAEISGEEFLGKAIANAFFGLFRFPDCPEVRLVINALVAKVESSPSELTPSQLKVAMGGLAQLDTPEANRARQVLRKKTLWKGAEVDKRRASAPGHIVPPLVDDNGWTTVGKMGRPSSPL